MTTRDLITHLEGLIAADATVADLPAVTYDGEQGAYDEIGADNVYVYHSRSGYPPRSLVIR